MNTHLQNESVCEPAMNLPLIKQKVTGRLETFMTFHYQWHFNELHEFVDSIKLYQHMDWQD